LNLRKGPDYETDKLAMLKAGDKVQFLETKGEWSRIKTSGNVEGYVQTKYVVNSQKLVSRAETPPQPHNSDLASEVLEYAQKFVGVKYVYGGKSPKGFDCSGFTQYVFEHFDIMVPRSAAEYDGIGTKISRSDIKPGDLVLLDRYWNNELGHVGIYIGNDKIIHASSRKGKIVIASLSEYTKYSGALMGIRRVIK
jgi:cell wall-associated NlpC family hydrolase